MCYNKGIFKWNDKNNREMNDREMNNREIKDREMNDRETNKFTRSSNELIELGE